MNDACGTLRSNEELIKNIRVKFEGKFKAIVVCVDGKVILQQMIGVEV
jgi:hypothetical protein